MANAVSSGYARGVLSSAIEQADYGREMLEWAFSSLGAYNVYYVKLCIWLSIQTLCCLELIAPAMLFPAPLTLTVGNEQTSYQPTGYALHTPLRSKLLLFAETASPLSP